MVIPSGLREAGTTSGTSPSLAQCLRLHTDQRGKLQDNHIMANSGVFNNTNQCHSIARLLADQSPSVLRVDKATDTSSLRAVNGSRNARGRAGRGAVKKNSTAGCSFKSVKQQQLVDVGNFNSVMHQQANMGGNFLPAQQQQLFPNGYCYRSVMQSGEKQPLQATWSAFKPMRQQQQGGESKTAKKQQQVKAPAGKTAAPRKSTLVHGEPPVFCPVLDRLYFSSLLEMVDRAIAHEYGIDNTTVLTLGETLEALNSVEKKLAEELPLNCAKLASGDKRNGNFGSTARKRTKLSGSPMQCSPLISRGNSPSMFLHSNPPTKATRLTSRSKRENSRTPRPVLIPPPFQLAPFQPSAFTPYQPLPFSPAACLAGGIEANGSKANGVPDVVDMAGDIELLLTKSEERMLLCDLELDTRDMMGF